jgi:hypothetical protein
MSLDKETDFVSETKNPARRNFLKTISMGFGAMVFFGAARSVAKAEPAKAKPAAAPAAPAAPAAGALELVKEDDPLPKGLGYLHDATKATRVDKAGTKAADQTCLNCQFYTKAGEVNKEEVGKCQLFPKGVVKAKGWCKSWIKKA